VLPAALGLAILLGATAAAVAQMDAIRREYDRRAGSTDVTSADQLLDLAKWCYQNELTDEAFKHALAAHKLAPEDLRPKYLIYALKRGPAEAEEPETPTEVKPPPKALTPPEVTDKQVDALWEEETPAVMNAFREVQAMLLKRCAAATCHGGNAEAKFALAAEGADPRKTAVQNFLAIRKYLDREKPEESALLQKPLGGRDAGHPEKVIRTKSDGLYRKGAAWIDSLLTEIEKKLPWAKGAGGEAAPPPWKP
jgi:hypothetical protein